MLKSKYSQSNLKNKWKIQQCRSEKLYFGYSKDCDNCKARSFCRSSESHPYYVNVSSSMLIFADSFENAKEYAARGHGWLLEKEIISGLPIELDVAGDSVSFKAGEDDNGNN